MKIKAVEMTRKIRDQIHRETEGMSWPELRAYIDEQIGDFDIGRDESPQPSVAPQAGAREALKP